MEDFTHMSESYTHTTACKVLTGIHIRQAALEMCCSKRRSPSVPEWIILSHVNCSIQGEVVGLPDSSDGSRERLKGAMAPAS